MVMDILGIPSHVQQWGDQGEQVLLLHGWGKAVTLDRHLAPLALALQDSCRVTALEFPAHGQSGKPQEDWGVPEYAAWVKAAIQALGLGPVTLVAHSFGGRVALWLSVHEPQLMRRMVLTGAAGLKRPQTPREAARARRYQLAQRLLRGIGRLPGLSGPVGRLSRRLRDSRSSADYLACDEDMKASFVRIVSQDLGPLLPRVGHSCLLIWGEEDEATPLWMGERMAREIPGAALIPLAGRGHFAYLEELSRFAAIVKAFIVEDGKQRV